jgi:hypothetical protein
MVRGVVLLGFRSGRRGNAELAESFGAARLLSKEHPRHDADRRNSRMYDPVAKRRCLSFKINCSFNPALRFFTGRDLAV